MRVISGSAKGVRLESLEGDNTRPTLDRVKEALFNIIQNEVIDAKVLDLFAGSGALGIESISRGAKQAVFCDKSYKAIQIINRNIQKSKVLEKSVIIQKDFLKSLQKLKEEKFDIIFLDPPYKENLSVLAVEKIIELDVLQEEGIIIIETDDEKRELEQLENTKVNVYDLRKYGRVKLLFLNRKG